MSGTTISEFPIPTEPILPLTIEQYHAMIRTGILNSDHPVELLNGWLIVKMPKNPRHRVATKLTRHLLESQITPDDYYVDSQEPITLSNSEPEPDVVVIEGSTRDYLDHHPYPENIVLIVEISDSTLERDQTLKKTLYARHFIPNYWILNLIEQQLEVYTNSNGNTYQQCIIYDLTNRVNVSLSSAINLTFTVQELLP